VRVNLSGVISVVVGGSESFGVDALDQGLGRQDPPGLGQQSGQLGLVDRVQPHQHGGKAAIVVVVEEAVGGGFQQHRLGLAQAAHGDHALDQLTRRLGMGAGQIGPGDTLAAHVERQTRALRARLDFGQGQGQTAESGKIDHDRY